MVQSTLIQASLFLSTLNLIKAYTLTLNQTYQGSTFFSGWNYNASAIDADNYGNVHFLAEADALSYNLTYINAANNAVIKVDNTTSGVGNDTFGRNVVRLISVDSIELGTLVIMDALHVPYGCSVWPSFWTIAASTQKSAQGEIDIFESVNLRDQNQMTLHTSSGCTQSNNTALPYTNSTVVSTDCDFADNSNQGCGFEDLRTYSAGEPFAVQGGGVYAMLWDGDGIQTWFFPRTSVPSDINSTSPDPTTWGSPAASWPLTTCDPSTYFEPQSLILGTNICGSFAGNAAIFAETCNGTCTDLVAEPSNYDTAYFEIAYIKTFSGAPTTSNITNATSTTSDDAAKSSAMSTFNRFSALFTVSFIVLHLYLVS